MLLTRSALVPPLLTSLTAVGLTSLVRLEAGPSIGYFLVTFVFSAVLTTALSTASPTLGVIVRRAFGVWVGTIIVWAYDVHGRGVTGTQWMVAALLLLSTMVELAITVFCLGQYGIVAPLPTALVICALCLWYACPIWAPSILNIRWVARIHPVLVLNGIMPDIGTWAQQPTAYQLTTLGQDLPYCLATSVIPALSVAVSWTFLMMIAIIARRRVSWPQRPASRR